MRHICWAGLLAGVLAIAAPAAVADPATPSNCTFSKGVTVCSTTTSSTAIESSFDPTSGCVLTTQVTTTVTTYSAHHGAPNSQGEEVVPPAPVTTVTDQVIDVGPCLAGGGGNPLVG